MEEIADDEADQIALIMQDMFGDGMFFKMTELHWLEMSLLIKIGVRLGDVQLAVSDWGNTPEDLRDHWRYFRDLLFEREASKLAFSLAERFGRRDNEHD